MINGSSKTSSPESSSLERPEKYSFIRDISIWIDEYDDIFSDFDSRPYSDRVVSDDFLSEINKVSKESEAEINELKLLIPEKARNKQNESIIAKRLHEFFRKNHHQLLNHRKKEIVTDILFLFIGILLMTGASFLVGHRHTNFAFNMMLVVLEPGGWFLVWNSLDGIFNDWRKKKPELDFYAGMAKCKIVFVSINP